MSVDQTFKLPQRHLATRLSTYHKDIWRPDFHYHRDIWRLDFPTTIETSGAQTFNLPQKHPADKVSTYHRDIWRLNFQPTQRHLAPRLSLPQRHLAARFSTNYRDIWSPDFHPTTETSGGLSFNLQEKNLATRLSNYLRDIWQLQFQPCKRQMFKRLSFHPTKRLGHCHLVVKTFNLPRGRDIWRRNLQPAKRVHTSSLFERSGGNLLCFKFTK